MKNIYQIFATACVFMTVTAISYAEDTQKLAPPETKATDSIHHGHNGGMGAMMASMTEEQKDAHMRAMQDHQLKMHDLSNQILAEKDTAKKEQLKAQQLQLMKTHHALMMEKHHPK